MNILFLDAYYEPEKIAYTHLERDLIEGLISEGHKIKIICPTPTRGVDKKTRKKYKGIRYEEKYNGSVIVNRFNAPKEGKNPITRAIRYFWCNFRTYQLAKKNNDIDIVFSNSTPPTQGALGGIVSHKLTKRKGKKVFFIYNLQDIFPDSLIYSNLSKKGGIIWKIGRKIENFTYCHADKIVLISQRFKNNLLAKGVPEEKIEVISNWIDLDSVYPIDRRDNKLITDFGLDPEKFIIVYAGNFGAAQGADIILKTARQLIEYDNMQFIVFGGGPYFESVKKEAEDLSNVIIHELMPQDRISEVYSLGDITLITCKIGTGKAGMPSKLWSIMACNTPIIASFDMDSDLADTIRDSKSGWVVEPENIEELKNKIIDVFLQNSREDINNTARSFVQNTASKQKCVPLFIDILEKIYEEYD